MNQTITEVEAVAKASLVTRFFGRNEKVQNRYIKMIQRSIKNEVVHDFPQLLKKMERIVEKKIESHKEDFYVVDQSIIQNTLNHTDYVWIVRNYGTHLIPLISEESLEERVSFFNAILRNKGSREYLYYHISATKGIKKIKEENVVSLIQSGVAIEPTVV